MPLQKLVFKPGINKEGTNYTNEGGWFDCDKVRFRSGQVEKIGGWTRYATSTFIGVCRALWNWVDLVGNTYIGIGTNKKYYISKGSVYYDVTPLLTNVSGNTTTTLGASPLSTTNGSPIVTVTDTTSGITPNIGDYVILTSTATVGGLTISGEYTVTSITDTLHFQITANANASSTTTGGGTVTLQYEYPVGNDVYTTSNGWGAGAWSPTNPVALGTNPFQAIAGSAVITVTQISHNYLYTAGAFIVEQQYKIVAIGSTDFTLIGASSNTVGTIFTATGVGTGSGTASIVWVAFSGVTDLIATPTVYSFSGTVGFKTGTYGIYGHGIQPAVPATLLNSTFEITYVSANTYTVTIATPALYGSVSGGTAVTVYPEYGIRPWGSAANVGIGSQMRLWSNDNFGQDLVIAPRGGSIYYWVNASGLTIRAQSLATLSTYYGFSGQFVPNNTNQIVSSAIQRFVIAFGANSYDPSNSKTPFDPLLVRWSDQENQYDWVPQVTNQAGEYRLSTGSYVVCARSTRQEILVWSDSTLYSMQYLGPPYVWGFQILQDNISIMGPNAAITVNNVTYWMGTDKFYRYTGRVETLACTLRQYVYQDINQDQNFQVYAGSIEGYNEIWWFYCSSNSDIIDRYVVYNYLDDVWYYGNMSRTSWIETGLQQYPIAAAYTPSAIFVGSITGTTLNVTSITSGNITLDTPILGSGITSGTTIIDYISGTGGIGTYKLNISQNVASEPMSIAGSSGQLLFHESGVDDVSGLTPRPIDSYVQSSDFDIGDGHNFGFVWRILPDLTFNGSTSGVPEVTMVVLPRVNSGSPYGMPDPQGVYSTQNYSNRHTYPVQQFTGQVYTRVRGRQMAFRIESDTLGVDWQLGYPRIDIRSDGRR
jgi:hypothetical protein